MAAVLSVLMPGCGKQDSVSNEKKYQTSTEAELKGIVRTTYDSPNPSAKQLERRKRSIARLKQMGLPVLETLPVTEEASRILPRDKSDVAKRCLATALCAVKGETRDAKLIEKLLVTYPSVVFSPGEQRFIQDENPKEQDCLDFAWRYECVHV